MQAVIDALKALLGDLGPQFDQFYLALAAVAFLLVLILVLSAIIRVIDRR